MIAMYVIEKHLYCTFVFHCITLRTEVLYMFHSHLSILNNMFISIDYSYRMIIFYENVSCNVPISIKTNTQIIVISFNHYWQILK